MANIEIKQGNKIIHSKTKMEKRTLLFYRHSCCELPKSSSRPAASLLPDVNRESELKVLVAQLHPTLCDPMDCSLPGSSVHRISHARTLEWVAYSFSSGIFLTQESKWGLLHCRWILYQQLSGKPLSYWVTHKIHI